MSGKPNASVNTTVTAPSVKKASSTSDKKEVTPQINSSLQQLLDKWDSAPWKKFVNEEGGALFGAFSVNPYEEKVEGHGAQAYLERQKTDKHYMVMNTNKLNKCTWRCSCGTFSSFLQRESRKKSVAIKEGDSTVSQSNGSTKADVCEWYEFGSGSKPTGEHMDVQGHVLDFILNLKLEHLMRCTEDSKICKTRENQKAYLTEIREIQNLRVKLFIALEKAFNKELIRKLPLLRYDAVNKLYLSIESASNGNREQTRSFIGQTQLAVSDHDYIVAKYNERIRSRGQRIRQMHDSLQAVLDQAQGNAHIVGPVEMPTVVFETPVIVD